MNNLRVGDLAEPHIAVAAPNDMQPRQQPLWPVFVIGLGGLASLLWTATLLWFLSRILLA